MRQILRLRQSIHPSLAIHINARRVFSNRCALAADRRLQTHPNYVASTMKEEKKYVLIQKEDVNYVVSKYVEENLLISC